MKFKQGYYIAINPIGIYHSTKPIQCKKCKPIEFKQQIQQLTYQEGIQCYMTKTNIRVYNEINQEYGIKEQK